MAKKKIIINHIAKMEGHSDFVADILDNDVLSARLKTLEGARFYEGLMIGRPYKDIPMLVQRICGICPIVHALGAVKVIEKAFDTKVNQQTIILRKILKHAQVIHSHGIHLFFLSLPDFFDISNDLNFIKKYPKEAKAALTVRKYGTEIARIVGGRTVHLLSTEPGGFKRWPTSEGLKKLLKNYDEVLDAAHILSEMFKKINYPDYERRTEFISLYDKNEYAFYDGQIKSSELGLMPIEDFYYQIKEIYQQKERVKRTTHLGKSYFLGALARVNNNYSQLNKSAKQAWSSKVEKTPTYNPFYNVLAQAVEMIHCIEETKKLIETYIKKEYKPLNTNIVPKAGKALVATEAPRGILIDYYEFDKGGMIKDCNIITPTAQFLANLEDDIKGFIPQIMELSDKQRKQKIRTLIRAYDPCISCATH